LVIPLDSIKNLLDLLEPKIMQRDDGQAARPTKIKHGAGVTTRFKRVFCFYLLSGTEARTKLAIEVNVYRSERKIIP
jgi:hypothetical protein